MDKQFVKASGPGATRSVPKPGMASALGPNGKAPAPRGIKKNTRDYGKAAPALGMETGTDPFGPTDGGSRLGGI